MNTDWNRAYKERPYIEQLPHNGVVKFINQFNREKSSKVLDLGCGDGRHLIFLAQKDYISVGVDNAIWESIYSSCIIRTQTLKIRLVYADVCFLPLESESFDQIISIQVIHHQRLKSIQKTIDGVRRLLRTNGVFYFTVPKYPPGNWKGKKYTEIEEHTFVPTEGFEKGIPHHFFTAGELRSVLEAFETLEIGDDSRRHWSVLVRKVK